MKTGNKVVRMLAICVTLFVTACGLTLVYTQEAQAYTYIQTNSPLVDNRLWVQAHPAANQSEAWLELVGADPNGPNYWMPSGTGDHSWNGRVSYWGVGLWKAYPDNLNGNYTAATDGNTKWVQGSYLGDTLKTLGDATKSAYINHHSMSESASGSAWGCIATYGWRGWAYTSDLKTPGGDVTMDSLLGAETWISNDFIDSSERKGFYYCYTYFWPRVEIQYDANGGIGADKPHYKYIGSSSNVSNVKPTRTGYTFEGWSLKKSGPVQIASNQFIGCNDWNLYKPFFEPGYFSWATGPLNFREVDALGIASPTESNVITLYAQWKPITYTVAYDGNGATRGTTAPSSHVYDTTKTLTPNGFERSYFLRCDSQGGSMGSKTLACQWVWKNWNTMVNGSGTAYSNQAPVRNLRSSSGTANLYAQWNPGSVVLPDPGTKERCSFKGWFTAPSGGILMGQTGAALSIAASTTYYAQWEERATISYYVDGEHDPAFSETVVAGNAYAANPEAANQSTKADCMGLDGWYTDAACTKRYLDGSSIPAQGLSLYGRNKVSVAYEFADQSHALFAGRELFSDEALSVSLTLEHMLPQAQTFHYGDRITFARGQSAWFQAHERTREATCEMGAYSTADASGVPFRTMRLTRNTIAYLLWLTPSYDGIALS